jgi:hypothetical protein
MATSQIVFKKEYNVNTIDQKGYSRIRIPIRYRSTRISDFLPFRVSFQNITVEGYGPSSPAPIGIAVIGFNNYIL